MPGLGLPPITFLGPPLPGGAYLLRIRVHAGLSLGFGRFKGGREIPVSAGEYAYVGSAMGSGGSASLAFRLLRHATRSGGRSPHPLRADLLEAFGMQKEPAGRPLHVSSKRLHWHIDYLLDRPEAELSHALVIRSRQRREKDLARLLRDDPSVRVLESGLGASDAPGDDHLLKVEADESWWLAIVDTMRRWIEDPGGHSPRPDKARSA